MGSWAWPRIPAPSSLRQANCRVLSYTSGQQQNPNADPKMWYRVAYIVNIQSSSAQQVHVNTTLSSSDVTKQWLGCALLGSLFIKHCLSPWYMASIWHWALALPFHPELCVVFWIRTSVSCHRVQWLLHWRAGLEDFTLPGFRASFPRDLSDLLLGDGPSDQLIGFSIFIGLLPSSDSLDLWILGLSFPLFKIFLK